MYSYVCIHVCSYLHRSFHHASVDNHQDTNRYKILGSFDTHSHTCDHHCTRRYLYLHTCQNLIVLASYMYIFLQLQLYNYCTYLVSNHFQSILEHIHTCLEIYMFLHCGSHYYSTEVLYITKYIQLQCICIQLYIQSVITGQQLLDIYIDSQPIVPPPGVHA